MRVLVAAAMAAGLAAGCGSSDGGGDAAQPNVLGATVFQGEATTVDGEPYDLGALAGTDVVVWFWAPW